MKTLNLDDFATDRRVIVFQGVEHVVREMSVDDFIAASVDAKVLEADEAGVAENLAGTINHLRRAIPTLEETTLRNLSLAQLVVLAQFVNGTLEREMKKGEVASGN